MKKLIFIIFNILLIITGYSQQNQTMYFMNIPQANITNPAIYSHCKLTISGLLIPITGQIMPPLYINYNNNAFTYKQFIHHGTGHTSDSLIFDFPQLIDHLKKVNYITFETHIPWLNVGYIWKDWYFNFSLTERFSTMISIPRDLVVLAWEGNGKSLLDRKAFLSFLGLNLNWYREYYIGAAKSLNNKWTVGGRAKLLFGKANLWFKNNQLTWHTNPADYAYTFNADMLIYESQPFFDITKFEYDYVNDSLMFDSDTLINPDNISFKDFKKKVLFNSKNKGFSIDLGAKYIYNNKITLYASLLDFGFIRYKQADGVKAKGEFYFDGWNIQPLLQKNDSITDKQIDNFRDSVIRIFNPQLVNGPYTYWLTSKLYVGGTYQFNEKYSASLLLRNEYFLRRVHSALTLHGQAKLTKWFSTNLSYTIQNNSFNNVGLGFALKFAFFQWYMVSDNVLGFIWPQSTQNINLRMGMNLIFGCKKKETSTFLNTNFIN